MTQKSRSDVKPWGDSMVVEIPRDQLLEIEFALTDALSVCQITRRGFKVYDELKAALKTIRDLRDSQLSPLLRKSGDNP